MTQLSIMITETNKRESTKRFYADIREEYTRLTGIQKHGIQLYHPDQVLAMVAKKFYRSPKTVENIVYFRV